MQSKTPHSAKKQTWTLLSLSHNCIIINHNNNNSKAHFHRFSKKMQSHATRDYLSQEHGIDIVVLSQKDVIEQEKVFWSVLQSHTDRFYSYYHIQEKSFVGKASVLQKIILSKKLFKSTSGQETQRKEYNRLFNGLPDKRTAINHIRVLKREISSLNRFLEVNKTAHTQILEQYNLIHCEDVVQREIDELEKTHSFWDGSRLKALIDLIDECSVSTTSTSSTNGPGNIFSFRKLQVGLSYYLMNHHVSHPSHILQT
jgi:FtsZ-binding cell division protein ZapB